eukprot:9013789-Alexandrium_andersonii.AAC.1
MESEKGLNKPKAGVGKLSAQAKPSQARPEPRLRKWLSTARPELRVVFSRASPEATAHARER